jgi:tetratricopeptide (TPR) repeat protein
VRRAEQLLRQDKLTDAIRQYEALVSSDAADWGAANALGDLYLRSGEIDRAVAEFTRAGDHLFAEGFFPRASALYKKVLKARKDDDHATWRLAEIAESNGLLLDARSNFGRLLRDRRERGDEPGAVECLVRLAGLKDADVESKTTAARALVEGGDRRRAAVLMMSASDLLTRQGRDADALGALQEARRLDPENAAIAERLEAAAGHQAGEDRAEAQAAFDVAPIEAVKAELEGVLAEIESRADAASPKDLEKHFDELRQATREEEERAREQYERGLRHLGEGRTAEAVANLEEAARTPAVRFEAASALARVALDGRDLRAAVEWLERAVEAPPPSRDDGLARMYDLADTLERLDEPARALAVFMEIAADRPGHGDVADRIARLSGRGASTL